jgi:hypothetical protein
MDLNEDDNHSSELVNQIISVLYDTPPLDVEVMVLYSTHGVV